MPTPCLRASSQLGDIPQPAQAFPETCSGKACWCGEWPMVRLIPSTGQRYTVEELAPEPPYRVFRYRYMEAA